ncbi:MAG TPA: phosphotransferase [Solirubrobacterales bacterium]|nr:phosphotransferase [Solirubrobacterales bacterium]
MSEQQLDGGNVSRVWRVGDTVRKPRAAWDIGVQALLGHLEETGFDGAPRALGTDECGRSIVSFITGEAPDYPMPAYVWHDDTLAAVARLLRAYHDATVGFSAPPAAGWQGRRPPGVAEVVCHNDVAPYNMVFRGGRPVALIDFDMAAPGPRVWDAAYAAYRFVPLGVPADDAPGEQGRRLALFMRSYAATFEVEELLDAVVARLAALTEFMHERAAAGEASFARHLAEGDAEIYQRDAQYISEQRDLVLKGFE